MQELIISEKRKKVVSRIGLVVLFAVILLTFLSKTIHYTLMPKVTTVQHVKGSLQKEFEEDGIIEHSQKHKLLAGGSWRVKEVKAAENQQVKKGDVLAAIDGHDIQMDLMTWDYELMKLENAVQSYKDKQRPVQLADYESELELAQKEMERAKKDLDLTRDLYEVGSESLKNVEAAEHTYSSKRHAYQQKKSELDEIRANQIIEQNEYDRVLKEKTAELELKKAELTYKKEMVSEDGLIRADRDGIITVVGIEAGTSTTHNQLMFEIAETPCSYAVVWFLDAEKYYEFSIGDQVVIEAMAEVAESGQKSVRLVSLSGKIGGRMLDTKTGSYKVRANIEDQGAIENVFFNEGQKAKVRSVASSPLYEYLLPKSCITQIQGRDCVFVVGKKQGALGEEYYVEQREVKILGQDDFNVAVDGYFKKKDLVVSNTSKPLSDMMQVYVDKAGQTDAR